MRKAQLAVAALALTLPLAAAPGAHATCGQRKTVGTVVGGVGGALIGHALFGGLGGLVVGGAGGALAGHAIASSGCHYSHARPRTVARYAPPPGAGPAQGGYGPPPNGGPMPAGYVQAGYYDQFGRPVSLPESGATASDVPH